MTADPLINVHKTTAISRFQVQGFDSMCFYNFLLCLQDSHRLLLKAVTEGRWCLGPGKISTFRIVDQNFHLGCWFGHGKALGIRTFLWFIAWDTLLTKESRECRGMTDNAVFYVIMGKNLLYMLVRDKRLQCPNLVWRRPVPMDQWGNFFNNERSYWLGNNLRDRTHRHSANEWRKDFWYHHLFIMEVSKNKYVYLKAKSIGGLRWMPPPEGWMKINGDGSSVQITKMVVSRGSTARS
ncbi:hypothetical protein VNO77_35712 [Canavalia gladiata]|uniref:Uncharacterized protein n=1 Tax=Canavalia gladiata TaxID=3824 RepID=A0AAN9K9M8_CANGL